VNTKIRKQIERRKGRIARRLDKNDNRGCDRPMMTASNIHYEIAGRPLAVSTDSVTKQTTSDASGVRLFWG
jgi:hypothetical protein